MDSIKDILPQIFEQLTERIPQTQTKIQRIWQNVVDAKMAQHSVLSDFTDGILTVAVDSSVRLYQMNLNRKKILGQLQEEIPDIKNIQFKIGKVQ
ncbi:MAG TPA: DUF721 domain-containing protein [Candidatus Omnitrophota bacterium]|nr:DUF721 domain-containing protein [Candidatus Omnitrophota bacterium]